MYAGFFRISKYPLVLAGGIDEMPVFFDKVRNQLFAKKGSKPIIVRTSGCEKKHVTVF